MQLLAEDVGQLVERDLDLEDVLAGFGSAQPARAFAVADGLSRLAFALPDALVAVVTVTETRQIDSGDGDADEVLALLSDQLAAGEELAQVLTDLPLDDLAEALVVFVDTQNHGGGQSVSG